MTALDEVNGKFGKFTAVRASRRSGAIGRCGRRIDPRHGRRASTKCRFSERTDRTGRVQEIVLLEGHDAASHHPRVGAPHARHDDVGAHGPAVRVDGHGSDAGLRTRCHVRLRPTGAGPSNRREGDHRCMCRRVPGNRGGSPVHRTRTDVSIRPTRAVVVCSAGRFVRRPGSASSANRVID